MPDLDDGSTYELPKAALVANLSAEGGIADEDNLLAKDCNLEYVAYDTRGKKLSVKGKIRRRSW